MTRALALGIVLVVSTAVVSAGIALAATGSGSGGRNGDDAPLAGQSLEKASAAALAHTGGGTVDQAEADDDAGYEVEVRLPDGKRVEVELDAGFAVVAEETGDDRPGNDDGPGDDGPQDDGQSGSAGSDD